MILRFEPNQNVRYVNKLRAEITERKLKVSSLPNQRHYLAAGQSDNPPNNLNKKLGTTDDNFKGNIARSWNEINKPFLMKPH